MNKSKYSVGTRSWTLIINVLNFLKQIDRYSFWKFSASEYLTQEKVEARFI